LADAIHLLAAGIWLGALAGLLLMLLRLVARFDDDHVRRSHAALAGFATVGTITVGLIVLTGMVNRWFFVGPANFWSVGESVYGQLLLAKLGLFAMMLALAAGNRFKLSSALVASADVSASVRALRLSLTILLWAQGYRRAEWTA
jgi:putative copper resistance protein D